MDKFLLFIIFIMMVIVCISALKIISLGNKIDRIRFRYDKLLRGRGELNIEEILLRHNDEIGDISAKNEEIASFYDDIKNDFEENTNSMYSDIKKLTQDLSEKQNREIEQLQNEYIEFRDNLNEEYSKQIKYLNEKLSFSMQKHILHKYDAFENQTGKLSFTFILLDQFNNGIMITSINGRESSYTYSKYIKNGNPDAECSADEFDALNMLLGK
ncbi:DUF4446 family protein [Helcococcus ovis]|uniref:DUF4446 family protein n=1 Tax=Helcococcus ovis TaxID=72026 RepID=A0A4R9C526_9FIRM|nr:DUF4446 family protein [Helcococcus ovis]TFF65358.1 DUF4446 family protein [Helcococcus ovis]TFF67685.1 DUF4446 family protein [Helcococcus ovis]TFF68744.1 DUF4446 family protein [Helcococcus ovis]WNZ01239.1 DUF4446 family protein [Helcococcus ovis]